ncbi:hypothetical protein PFISCL1PPCAC_18147, partial [Pristionchus fissidentatus]
TLARKIASRLLILLALIHIVVIIADFSALCITNSKEWKNEHIQAFALCSLLVLFVNSCLPLVLAAVLFRQRRALTLIAAFSTGWIAISELLIILAYSDLHHLLKTHPACPLTLLTLALTV